MHGISNRTIPIFGKWTSNKTSPLFGQDIPVYMRVFLFTLLLLFIFGNLFSCGGGSDVEDQTFIQDELAWQKQQDESMRAPDGWLTIAGLYWLEEGLNTFGASSENKIQLPEGSAPLVAGTFFYRSGEVSFQAQDGVELLLDDKPANQGEFITDAEGDPTILSLKDLRMWIIDRDGRHAVRLRDLNHSPFKNSRPLEFFAPDPKYKLLADFIPHTEPRSIRVETQIGTTTEMLSPGSVRFSLDDREFKLLGFSQGGKNLFIIFKDLTNGVETYEASRFLTAEILEEGRKVNLNFNRAYNPPCAFTPYATCPLPPPENILDIRIAAGEKRYNYN